MRGKITIQENLRPTKRAANFLLIGLGLIASLIILEVVVRFHLPPPRFYSFWQYHPVLGHTLIPNFHEKYFDEDDQTLDFKINFQGFRDREFTEAKEKGAFRIALLGDSYLEAAQVAVEDSFPKVMEDKLNFLAAAGPAKYEAFNFGTGDYGTAQEYLILQNYALRYRPDLVVLVVFPLNDILNNSLEFAGKNTSDGDYFRPYFVFGRDGDLTLTYANPIRALLRRNSSLFVYAEYIFFKYRKRLEERGLVESRLTKLARKNIAEGRFANEELNVIHAAEHSPEWQRAWKITEALVLKIKHTAEAAGAKFLAMVVPFPEQVHTDWWESTQSVVRRELNRSFEWDLDKPERTLEKFFSENKIDHLILLPIFREYARKETGYLYAEDGHLSKLGHRVVAKALIEKLIKDGLAPNISLGEPFRLKQAKGDTNTPLNSSGVKWEHKQEPVLSTGGPNAWDSVAVDGPSVAYANGKFYMLYSGFDGSTWRVGMAESDDGACFKKYEKNPIISLTQAAAGGSGSSGPRGALAFRNGAFYYWYATGTDGNIGLAISTDAKVWKELAPVALMKGERGAWDDACLSDPSVAQDRDYFYMCYVGMNAFGRVGLGIARSKDGKTWEKSLDNPILSVSPSNGSDRQRLLSPNLFEVGKRNYLIYTGYDAAKPRLNALRPTSGLTWKRVQDGLNLEAVGSEHKEPEVMHRPTILMMNGNLNIWYIAARQSDKRLGQQIRLYRAKVQQTIRDLLAEFPYAEIDPTTKVDVTPSGQWVFRYGLAKGEDYRKVIVTLAGSEIRFKVEDIPPGAMLDFGVCMAFDNGSAGQANVLFESNGQRIKLYSRDLDPAHKAGDRAWFNEQVALSELEGKSGKIIFRADTGPTGDMTGLWIGWSYPRMIR